MVIHSDARPFSCPHCTSTFKRKDKLKYHLDHVHGARLAERPLPMLGEDKMAPAPFEEASKSFDGEPKSAPANVCLPVTFVPVHLAVRAQRDHRGAPPLSSQTHSSVAVQPLGRQQSSGYQPTTELAFLEKYTLSSQPASSVHGLRPEQMMEQRDQSYLGTLLGLDSSSVQNISSSDHTR